MGFTLIGSTFFMLAIILIYLDFGTTDISYIKILCKQNFNHKQPCYIYVICICLLIAFGIKVPLVPFHKWLPEVHVEAPTDGSIILAALLLKLGGFGLLKFFISPLGMYGLEYSEIIIFIAMLGSIFAAILACDQGDVKKYLAYSSISHMNFALVGLFSNNIIGITGSIGLMIGHSITTAALFTLVGFVYDRYDNRDSFDFYTRIVQTPFFTYAFFFFSMSNLGFPFLANFPGELIILLGLEQKPTLLVLSLLLVFITAKYNIDMILKIVFAPTPQDLIKYSDLTVLEVTIIKRLVVVVLLLGIYPVHITDLYSIVCKMVF